MFHAQNGFNGETNVTFTLVHGSMLMLASFLFSLFPNSIQFNALKECWMTCNGVLRTFCDVYIIIHRQPKNRICINWNMFVCLMYVFYKNRKVNYK